MQQPDLYSGQALYYIKKVMGICKSTCLTFLQNFFLLFWRGEKVLCSNAVAAAAAVSSKIFPPVIQFLLHPPIFLLLHLQQAVFFSHRNCLIEIVCNNSWNILRIQAVLCFQIDSEMVCSSCLESCSNISFHDSTVFKKQICSFSINVLFQSRDQNQL